MYEELSKETGEFFNYMIEHDLMDLVAKKVRKAADTVRLSKTTNHRLSSRTLMAHLVISMY